jgi:hypothetical protein
MIYLVAYSIPGDDIEAEALHPPFQKLVSSSVALKFRFHVPLQGVGSLKIDLHRMIDHQVWDCGLYFAGRRARRRQNAWLQVDKQGTPVKSCSKMRATRKGIRRSCRIRTVRQLTTSSVILLPSQLRKTASSRIRILKGSLDTPHTFLLELRRIKPAGRLPAI